MSEVEGEDLSPNSSAETPSKSRKNKRGKKGHLQAVPTLENDDVSGAALPAEGLEGDGVAMMDDAVDELPHAEAAATDDEVELGKSGAGEIAAERLESTEPEKLELMEGDLPEASDDEEEGSLAGDPTNRPGLEKAPPVPVGEQHLKSILESLVFVADKPVTALQLSKLSRSKTPDVKRLLEELALEYRGRGIELAEVAGGYLFRSAAVNSPFVRDFVAAKPVRLSRAQIETLAITAYRQPVTRPEVEDVRGVDSGSAMRVLLDRGLVRMLGRKEEAGRPLLYGTTPQFLEFFGLKSLKELPTLREFSDLSDESRALFERKMGTPVGDLHAAGQVAELSNEEIAEAEAELDAELAARPEGDTETPVEPAVAAEGVAADASEEQDLFAARPYHHDSGLEGDADSEVQVAADASVSSDLEESEGDSSAAQSYIQELYASAESAEDEPDRDPTFAEATGTDDGTES